jgi:hypothetical protein
MSEQNLYQRLLAVQAGIESVKVTGKTQQGKPVSSIDDVEEALGDLFLSAGVFTTYTWNEPAQIVLSQGEEGKNKVWSGDITYIYVNADDPEERLEVRTFDVGSNPSAAVSAAIKRLQRGTFHLMSDGEGNDNYVASGSAPATTYQSSSSGDRPKCPSCGSDIWESRYGDDPKDWYCNKNKGGCGWKGPKPKGGTGEVRKPTAQDEEEAASLLASESEPVKPSRRAAASATVGPKPKPLAVVPAPAEDDDLPGFDFPELPAAKPEHVPPSESLTVKTLRLAIDVKKLQLNEAEQEVPDAKNLGILVRKSLDKACEQAFGHNFQEATDAECEKLIDKFEKFLAQRKALAATASVDGVIVE